MLMALWTCLAMQGQTIKPPMHRAWSYIAGESTDIIAVRQGTVFLVSRNRVAALALSTGKPMWESKFKPWKQSSTIGDSEVFVAMQDKDLSRISAFDLRTGKERILRTLPDNARKISLGDRHLFVLMPGLTIEALDPITGKTVWTRKLSDKPKSRGVGVSGITAWRGFLYAGIDDLGVYCLDQAKGGVLWKEAREDGGLEDPIFWGEYVLTQRGGLRLRRLRDGHESWTAPKESIESFGIVADVLISESWKDIVGRSLTTGKVLWKFPGGEEGFSIGGGERAAISDQDGVLLFSTKFQRIDAKGNIVWSSDRFFTGRPEFANDKFMLCNDGDRLLCYVPGTIPALPIAETERKAFAEVSVANWELLDNRERDALEPLGKFASRPLIRKYVAWAKEAESDNELSDRGMLLYSLLTESPKQLQAMCGPENTPELVAAIDELGPKNSYRENLVAILGSKGDPARTMPKYVDSLRKNPPKPNSWDRTGSMLDTVAKSRHPVAVQYMIECLANPRAPVSYRREAFRHLAGTGGQAGAAAVRAARRTRRSLVPWEQRIEIGKLPPSNTRGEKIDAKGRTWKLISHSVLGNGSDLFIVQKSAKGWGKPVFLGVFTDPTWSASPPKSYRGVPLEELVKTEWIKLFPDDPAIRKDSDKDGLTDLVEVRYGTDPKKADTDGDGVKDSVDPCPNAPPRTLGDREKIIAACLEARFFEEGWHSPAIIDVSKIGPFEFYGYSGAPVFWRSKSYKGTLESMYNTGVNMISFHGEREKFSENVRERDWVEIAADRKSARTTIRRYSGGLNGDGIQAKLIKVGDDWFVVELVQQYVS